MDAMADALTRAITEKLIRNTWCKETASPGCQADWSEDNPAWGQCAVTALTVRCVLGGDLLRTVVEGYGSHYYNRLPDGTEIDFTRDQFSKQTLIPPGEVVDRDKVLFSPRAVTARTKGRYEIFLKRFSQS